MERRRREVAHGRDPGGRWRHGARALVVLGLLLAGGAAMTLQARRA
ncbi:hypothetical protein [Jiangella aurantiaca]|nr:hypothetical protein [Jiangella aurantiaca]